MNKGFAAFAVLIILAVIAVVAGIAYVHLVALPQMNGTPAIAPPGSSSSGNAADANNVQTGVPQSKNYSLSLCGVTLTVKTGQTVNMTADPSGSWADLSVGDPMPGSVLDVSCTSRNGWDGHAQDTISYVLSVQSDGSSKVDKNGYLVFDGQTGSLISQLYSAKNGSYRSGSETIGFETADWLYLFSFLDPAQARNQDSFAISVATGAFSQKSSGSDVGGKGAAAAQPSVQNSSANSSIPLQIVSATLSPSSLAYPFSNATLNVSLKNNTAQTIDQYYYRFFLDENHAFAQEVGNSYADINPGETYNLDQSDLQEIVGNLAKSCDFFGLSAGQYHLHIKISVTTHPLNADTTGPDVTDVLMPFTLASSCAKK
jgi:hypothetical protein